MSRQSHATWQLAAALDASADPNTTTAPDHDRRVRDAGPADVSKGTGEGAAS